MANWFEDHPIRSIISHTVLVAGITWAVSTYILKDNRLKLVQGEVDSQKAISEQYKSKIELLQREVEALRTENFEYKAWLVQSKDAIPVMVPQLLKLKEKVLALEEDAKKINGKNPGNVSLLKEQFVSIGKAYIDRELDLIVTVKKISIDRAADVVIRFPDKSTALEAKVNPGEKWDFSANGEKFNIVVSEISWIGDRVGFIVSKIK